jgi:hypothetical protein
MDNFLRSKSPIEKVFERELFSKLSQLKDLNPQFQTFDWEREIERVDIIINGYCLTYHFGWIHPDNSSKTECPDEKVSEASWKFFQILNGLFKNIPKKITDNRIFRARHRCLAVIYDVQTFIPTPTYWELKNFVKIQHH